MNHPDIIDSPLKRKISRNRIIGQDKLKNRIVRGMLPTTCWCERAYVLLSVAQVKAGITESCGHPSCAP